MGKESGIEAQIAAAEEQMKKEAEEAREASQSALEQQGDIYKQGQT